MHDVPESVANSSANLSFEAFTAEVPGAYVRSSKVARAAAKSAGEAAVARASAALALCRGSSCAATAEQEFKEVVDSATAEHEFKQVDDEEPPAEHEFKEVVKAPAADAARVEQEFKEVVETRALPASGTGKSEASSEANWPEDEEAGGVMCIS